MTRVEVVTMISSLNIPFSYYQFDGDTAVAPPFICYFYPRSDDLYADDSNYAMIRPLVIELYTKTKDFDLEDTVEQTLATNGFSFYKEENYLDTERMWQIAYEMEVLIDG